MAPTMSCDRRVIFQDWIDVGHVPVPKPRVISLEPISKRDIVKARVKQASADQVPENAPAAPTKSPETESPNPSMSDRPPLSPAPSVATTTSAITTSSQSFQILTHSPLTTGASGRTSETKSTSTSMSGTAITASTEILRAGALPGDIVPLRISIVHTKPQARGPVIVTLYRQGRIDMHPLIPLTTRSKGKKPEYEDVYPRSKTGLGGLHFSNNSPSSVFRKDLCQTSAMMVVNPHTLTADIRASIRIPEDAFPTMVNTPGGMIEFRYFVEVVIDLCGKLGESSFLPRLSFTSPPQSFSNTNSKDSSFQVTSNWADNILDTAQVRRVKAIVNCLFEVVVGSKDTTRTTTKKWQDDPSAESQRSSHVQISDQPTVDEEENDEASYQEEPYGHGAWAEHPADWEAQPPSFPRFVPPPEPEEQVDEKTRLRREEALLLPSQPSDPDASSSAPEGSATAPSAPIIIDQDGLYDDHDMYEGGGVLDIAPVTRSATSTRSMDTIVPSYSNSHPLPAREYEIESPADDKQELERQRLMAQASGPPLGDEDAGAGSSAPVAAPSAPQLPEADEYNAHTLNHDDPDSDNLPRYRT